MKEIRIISPAGALDADFTFRAAERLKSLGYAVQIAEHATGRYGRFAATPEQRTADAVAALTDQEVGLLLCTRGGYGMQQIIDRIEVGRDYKINLVLNMTYQQFCENWDNVNK